MEVVWQQVIALGANRVEAMFQRCGEMGAAQGQMPEEEEGRRDSKHEKEQGKTSQHLVLPVPGGFSEGTPASLMELNLLRIRGAYGECGGAGNSGAANERKRTLSNSLSRERLPMEEDANL